MPHTHRVHGYLPALFVVVLLLAGLAPIAVAQPARLPAQLLTANQLDDNQRQLMKDYAIGWAAAFQAAVTPDTIKEAREKIIEPLRNRLITPVVRDFYSVEAAKAIAPLIQSESFLVRLNVVVTCSFLLTGEIADTCVAGLKDENPAVRYWAAKAIVRTLKQQQEGQRLLSGDQRDQVFDDLREVVRNESVP